MVTNHLRPSSVLGAHPPSRELRGLQVVIATKTTQQLQEQLGYVWTSDVGPQGQGGDFFFERKTSLEVALFFGGEQHKMGPY